MMELLFTCAICRRDVHDYSCRNGRDRALSPLCRYCEGYYGDTKPGDGAFMDRRVAVQISALANALRSEAGIREWSARHG